MAFMKIFPKNPTVIMDDFWPFEPCVERLYVKGHTFCLIKTWRNNVFIAVLSK